MRTLLKRLFRGQSSVRWYLFAVSYMAGIKLVALTYRMMTSSWPLVSQEPIGTIVVAIIISTPFQSGEEVGWRGFALPLLAKRIGFTWASIMLGLIWACWHLPLNSLGASRYRLVVNFGNVRSSVRVWLWFRVIWRRRHESS